MCSEVVEGRRQRDRAIDFEESLAGLIVLRHVPVIHPPNSGLGGNKRLLKFRHLHQPRPAAGARLVGSFLETRLVARELEGERGLPMGGTRPAMAAMPASKVVGTPDIQVRRSFAEQVDAGQRYICCTAGNMSAISRYLSAIPLKIRPQLWLLLRYLA